MSLPQLPELAAPALATELPSREPTASVPTSSPAVPRGMQVLQRMLGQKAASDWWKNGWPRRLWITAAVLTCLSGVALVTGFLQKDRAEMHAVYEDDFIIDETETDYQPGSPAPQLAAQSPAITRTAGTETGAAQAVTHAAGYVVESAAAPATPPRGAWLEGTILPDDSE